jgi:hypothetical protein
MEVESLYKSFYEEYDVAFSLHCIFSICDRKSDSRWQRMEGDSHVYRTPVLYIINRTEMEGSPAQIAYRMLNRYCANTLVIEKYEHQKYDEAYLKSYLADKGIHLILKEQKVHVSYRISKKPNQLADSGLHPFNILSLTS